MSRARWAFVVAACALVVAAVAMAYAAGKARAVPVQEVVRAKRFELVDASGRVVARLATTERSEPRLVFYDRRGTERAELALGRFDGPALVLMDKNGHLCASLGDMVNDGGPMLYLWGDGPYPLAPSASVGVDRAAQRAFVSLEDKDGRQRVAVGAVRPGTARAGGIGERSESCLVLLDKRGNVLWEAP